MVLDNRATPKYYGEFREKVMRGLIPVNREVSLEMNRIEDLISDPRYYYDNAKVEGFIKYCERELTLTDGSDFHMLDSFKLWAEQVFGWYHYVERQRYKPNPDGSGGKFIWVKVKKRLVTKQYLIVARGAAKSMYAECIQSYFLNIDASTTHQITTAPTMKQADEVMAPFRTAITRARGPLFKFLTEGSMQNTTGSRANRQKLASTKKGIENWLNGSLLEVRPMSVDKLQGLRPKISTVDEWLSGDIKEDVVGAIEQGATKLDDWLIVAISSEGTVRNGVGDNIKMELNKILTGEYYAPHISIWHYKLDDVAEVAQPEMWLKAQPNLDKTVTYDTYILDVERAEQNPATRNDILAKRFGIPAEGYVQFFTAEECLPGPHNDFRKLSCTMGVDLSQGDDFCAFTFLFPLGNYYGVKTRSYITKKTYDLLPPALQAKYDLFIDEGTLIIMEGVILDMMAVFDDLDHHIHVEKEYAVMGVGYDPYAAKEFMDRWESDNGPWGVVKVPQGARTESVPLGELKKLAAVPERGEIRQLAFDEMLMQFSMGNAITLEDTNGNRKLYKARRENKIDNFSALLDAWVAYKDNKEAFG